VQKQTSHKKLRGPERKEGEEDFLANRLQYSTEIKQKQTPNKNKNKHQVHHHIGSLEPSKNEIIAAYSKEVEGGKIYNVLLGAAECNGGIYIHIHANTYTFTIKRSGK